MKPTDTSHPDYFHKVVDCQWGCPAHTDVPGYIRLIAQGRFTDAYMLNRASNVFPAILGRVCDRPCEPACRRVRVEDKPVAICRLKRVAADLRDDISDQLPVIPKQKNGKRIANPVAIGGPAMIDALLSVKQVATSLGLGTHAVLALIKCGAISASDVSSRPNSGRASWRIRRSDVDNFLDKREYQPPTRRRRRRKQQTPVTKYF